MLRKLFLAFGALAAAGWAAHAAPLEAYGKLPNVEDVAISPSGKLIAFIATNGDARTVIVQTIADRQTTYAAAAGAAKLRGVAWVGDTHLILTFSTAKLGWLSGHRRERFLATDINLQTGKATALLDNVPQPPKGPRLEVLNVLGGLPEVRNLDGKPTLFVYAGYWNGAAAGLGVFRIDLDHEDQARLYEDAGEMACDLLLGPNGNGVAMATCDDRSGAWTLKVKPGSGGWRTAQKIQAPIDTPSLVGLSANGGSALVMFDDDGAGHDWRQVDLTTGAWGETVVNPDGKTPITDHGRIIGEEVLAGDDYSVSLFDPHEAAIWRGVAKAFPGDLVEFVSWSDDRQKIVVLVDSPDEGPAYSLVDLATGQADWLGARYAALKPEDISPVRSVRYKAGDGLEISGYLTLPRGRPAKGLPLVVLPHGGPEGRDAPGFDWWSQALASRGYAVLRPNFRGSSGFGGSFKAAGFGQYGRKMETDLSDGVRFLAAEGVINPKRVCIAGASYGGYAALAGAALDRGVYRCAVSYAGPADLRSQFMDAREKGGDHALRYWMRYVGAKDLNDAVLAELSPTAHATEVNIPVLLIHGRDDTVVPVSQSRRMAEALRAAGRPVELVELDGEDHWLSGGATRLQMLQATVAFLEKNNPPN
jgi:dipeptidyl aminopeptidase/acylaminoacyl peptidase